MAHHQWVQLWLASLLLYASVMSAEDTTSPTTSPSTSPEPTSSSLPPSPPPTLSGCQTCAATGDCSHAYLDGPGQFCGNWLDQSSQRQRCCCPRDSSCRVSNYSCNCERTPSRTRESVSKSSSSRVGVWLLLLLVLTIAWCGYRLVRGLTGYSSPSSSSFSPMLPMAQPIDPTAMYKMHPQGGAAHGYAPMATAPTGYYPGSHSGYSPASGLQTVGQVAAGMVVGGLVLDGIHSHYGGGGHESGSYGDGGGGGDFGGGGNDFGGDF